MYIIIIGGGEVGSHLSKILLNDGHEVLIVEQDAARSEKLADELGSIVLRGDGCEAATLESIGAARADMLVAVTDDDARNLVACQVAKYRFKVRRTIARVTNPKNEDIFKILGVDVTVCSTQLILAHIEQELPSHPLIPLLKLKTGTLEVIEAKIPPDSNLIGKKLKSFVLPKGSAVLLIISKEKGPQIPTDDTLLAAEDEVVAITEAHNEEAIKAMLTSKK
ncbi:MAG TPA: NAD-binding protein [Dehalococcoidia bacterium]|nr:NAD-binding protein [Dehalococcoidia bacterium]